MKSAKLSKKNQVVIPKAVRERLKLRPGSRIALYPIDDQRAVIMKDSTDPVEALDGLGKEIWEELGGTDAYIERERASWGDR